ncbi:MAG: hypothetical protein INH41_11640 [Myxococcaceae bacterium]|nr:hypothetical protein [Myxococcaceae bacterium]MCA3013035.1 hypothetical protein [Myxococcaceae bacterium]
MAINRIDSTPVRISTNFTVGKQSQGVDFGQRIQAGLANTGNALAAGAGLLGGAVPGMGIVSAAVSSVSNHIGGPSSASYASSGLVNVGGGVGGPINTTVGGGNGPVVSSGMGPNFGAGVSQNDVGMGNQAIGSMQGEMTSMLRLQFQMQKENMAYTSMSNVMKGKHDTVKNTIQNVR